MANPGYIRSTDGNDADDGSTWALANASAAGAVADSSAGDTVYFSQVHSEAPAANTSHTWPGTLASPNRLICANDGAEPPTTQTTGAVIGVGNGAYTLTESGVIFVYGLTLRAGTGGLTNSKISLATGSGNVQYWDTCTFEVNATGAAASILIGSASNQTPTEVTLENCTVSFKGSSNIIALISTRFRWFDGAANLLSAGTSPTDLFQLNSSGEGIEAIVAGVDFSALSSSMNFVKTGTTQNGTLKIYDCKLPSSWTGSLVVSPGPGFRAEMYRCDSSTANYHFRIQDHAGLVSDESTLIKSGTAFTVGGTDISVKMVSTGDCSETRPLVSQTFSLYNTATGSSKTLTIPILHDSATNLQDDEVFVRVRYKSSATSTISTLVSDQRSSHITAPADQDADAASTWTTTGMTNPNKQKLVVSFTPQLEGVVEFEVCLSKPSYTIYADIPAALT